jgi:hypothetical protein
MDAYKIHKKTMRAYVFICVKTRLRSCAIGLARTIICSGRQYLVSNPSILYCAEGSLGEFWEAFRLGRSADSLPSPVFPFRLEGMLSPINASIIAAKSTACLSSEDEDTPSPPIQRGVAAKPSPCGRAWACACITSASTSVSCGEVE